jgi:hypothetical protein
MSRGLKIGFNFLPGFAFSIVNHSLYKQPSSRHCTLNLYLSADADVIRPHAWSFEEGASTWRRHGSQPRSFADISIHQWLRIQTPGLPQWTDAYQRTNR